jgi:hypothetical protein
MLQISRALNLHSWSESRKLLKSFIWVNIVGNQAGENFFNEAWRYDPTQETAHRHAFSEIIH